MAKERILILGLGRSGTSLARYLLSRGNEVFAYDDNEHVFTQSTIRELVRAPAFHILLNLAHIHPDLAIASPGIPDDAPIIQLLRAGGIKVVDEVDFGYGIVGKRIVAVTGTNGKSTTTTLIGEMLRADGRDIFYGGNLAPGQPFSAALLDLVGGHDPQSKTQNPKSQISGMRDYYVLELSSFQLERCEKLSPVVAVLLNITPDHLDQHGTMEHYRTVKFSIFRNQTDRDWAVVNLDDELVRTGIPGIPARVVSFALADSQADARLEDGWLTFRGERILSSSEVRLPGRHNLANALAALAAARCLGVRNESIVQILTTFRGLEHRLEFVQEIRGVRYVNNSMCTNPAAAIESLQAFDAPVILITGGREKDLPIGDYLQAITQRARAAILVGENRQRLYDGLTALGYAPLRVATSLVEALHVAQELGRSGDVVLFSPGFASFDAYADFQERGKAFKDAVRENLPG